MNPSNLLTLIPAHWRKYLYGAFAVVGIGLGATQAGFAAVPGEQPSWLTITLVVYAYVGTALGVTAASNVQAHDPKHRKQQ